MGFKRLGEEKEVAIFRQLQISDIKIPETIRFRKYKGLFKSHFEFVYYIGPTCVEK